MLAISSILLVRSIQVLVKQALDTPQRSPSFVTFKKPQKLPDFMEPIAR